MHPRYLQGSRSNWWSNINWRLWYRYFSKNHVVKYCFCYNYNWTIIEIIWVLASWHIANGSKNWVKKLIHMIFLHVQYVRTEFVTSVARYDWLWLVQKNISWWPALTMEGQILTRQCAPIPIAWVGIWLVPASSAISCKHVRTNQVVWWTWLFLPWIHVRIPANTPRYNIHVQVRVLLFELFWLQVANTC